jgi:hypothetical protein
MADQFAKLSDIAVLASDLATPGVSEEARVQFAEFAGAVVQAAKIALDVASPVRAESDNLFGTSSGLAFEPGNTSLSNPADAAANSTYSIQVLPGLYIKDWLRQPIVFIRDFLPGTRDLAARISGFLEVYIEDIPASISPFHLKDLTADAFAYPPEDLTASLDVNEAPNLQGIVEAIASVNLPAFAGGHFPEDLTAAIAPYLPVDLPLYIIGGQTDTIDLSAGIQQVGGFKDLGGFSRASLADIRDLAVKILPRCPADLSASLHGFDTSDLPGYILTQRIKDMRGIVKGWSRENEASLRAVVRITFAQQENMPVEGFKAVISTHTSANLYNLDRVKTTFFGNKFLFGTKRGGAFKFILEPVFGHFPDLSGDIFARLLSISNFPASIKSLFASTQDLTASTVAVTSNINVNKIGLVLTPLKDLQASIIQRGGFKGLRSIVRGVVKGSTYTDPDAGFSTTATSYRFLLGTTGGLVIPSRSVPTLIITSHFNPASIPDLHATIAGWIESNLTASIKEYEFSAIPASLKAQDLSFISALSAYIAPFRERDLSSSIASTGEFESLTSTISVGGGVSDLTTFIQAYINPLSYNVVPVSTKPFQDLSAIINYESYVRCALHSQSSNLSAFVKVLVGNTEDTKINLAATLNVLRIEVGLSADVVSRKRTRLRTLTLNFRTGIRSSVGINTVVVPLRSTQSSLLTSIVGLSHTKDLSADVEPVRYRMVEPLITASETVVKLDNPDYSTNILVSFRSIVSSYVYEELTTKVYATDEGTWVLDMRTENIQGGFFDLQDGTKVLKLDDVTEYNTLDEAIRAGIVILTEQRRVDIPASISVEGQIGDLPVTMGVTSADMLRNLTSHVTVVENQPDLAALINTGLQSSAFNILKGLINPQQTAIQQDMSAEIDASTVDDLGASLTVS